MLMKFLHSNVLSNILGYRLDKRVRIDQCIDVITCNNRIRNMTIFPLSVGLSLLPLILFLIFLIFLPILQIQLQGYY